MGVAVGAGNIWRFSRIVAQNGGGSFIIPWVIFLFTWSIPLIIAELALGKLTRKGPIGALALTAGRKFGWMGAFIALVATGILFYYSVVVGWGGSYFFYAITGKLIATTDYETLWSGYLQSYQPLLFHIFAITVACFVVYKGIVRGIEFSNKILIPALCVMILIIAVRAFTLPNAIEGIRYLFIPNFEDLFDLHIWMEALTQNAWDTGAGWGLLLVYACFAKKEEKIVSNGALTAIANNLVSLIMGMIIFSTAFSLESRHGLESLMSGVGSSNTGLTFIYLPELFKALPGHAILQSFFAALFFLAFMFAALSSMISMVQLTSQVIHELGVGRAHAILLTGILTLFIGIPSALSQTFFNNQDWVWSVGLIVSGLFIAFSAIRFGLDRYRKTAINSVEGDIRLGKFYNIVLGVLIPIQGIFLLAWYFYKNIGTSSWWNPFAEGSLATLVMQWGLAIIVFIGLNKLLVRRTLHDRN